ncbi:MAG TPA: hypothetical protein VLL05_21100 [Terriglobales bacterium]|nr:hypothetical protein [Terriglobales bacterium]
MSHFSEQTWADFVRGIDVDGRKFEVEVHLGSACPECKSEFETWERVVRFALQESNYTVPDGLVQAAKAGFTSTESTEPESWNPATLLFDSALVPLPVGIRSGTANTRQLIYEGEGLTVDMRFERKPNSPLISATGQVLDKAVPLRWLGKAAIVLWNDKGHLLSKTEAGEYGEFQFEFVPQDHLRMSIATADRRTLRIALGNLE